MAPDLAVSVVVPVHNRREQLAQAVASVCRQTVPPAEVIIVDDGSTDGSGDALDRLHPMVRVHRQERRGRSSARNTGITQASGELIALLDSDDLWLPHKLEEQVPLFRKPAAARTGMVGGHVLAIDEQGLEIPSATALCRQGLDGFVKAGCTLTACVRTPGVYTSSVVLRRSALDDVGGFNEGMDANEDWDLWLRIARRWETQITPWPPVAKYRVHEGNTSSRAMAEGTITLARRHLAMTPPMPRSAQAHLLVKQARAHRTLGQEREARGMLARAFTTSPTAAAAGGAARLLMGSVLATTSATCRPGMQGPGASETED